MGSREEIEGIIMQFGSAQIVKKLTDAGYVIVPKEPTKEMIRSAERFGDSEGYGTVTEFDAKNIWEDMINAFVKAL